MTEIELSERIESILTERPIQQKESSGSCYSRSDRKVRKDDRLLKIMNYGGYSARVGYVDWGAMGERPSAPEDYDPKPEVYMATARRKTTIDERKEIVEYCLPHDICLEYCCVFRDCIRVRILFLDSNIKI